MQYLVCKILLELQLIRSNERIYLQKKNSYTASFYFLELRNMIHRHVDWNARYYCSTCDSTLRFVSKVDDTSGSWCYRVTERSWDTTQVFKNILLMARRKNHDGCSNSWEEKRTNIDRFWRFVEQLINYSSPINLEIERTFSIVNLYLHVL